MLYSICPTGMCRFLGYRFRLFFLEQGIKGKFSGAGCQNRSKEEILLQWVIIYSNFCVFEYTFYQFFLEQGYHWKAKILEQGEKILFRGHIPVQIQVKYPPPGY